MSWGDGGPPRSRECRLFPSTVRPPYIIRSQRERGFTLLEVLLSIAIIALVASVLVGGAAHMISDQPVTSHEVFWKAVREARKAALKAEHDIRLKFDRDKKQFYLIDGLAPSTADETGTPQEVRIKTFPTTASRAGELTVEFLGPSAKGAHTILLGGLLLESKSISYVTFYSDGTCMPFRAQFARGGSSSILSIDPWTCAPILPPPDPNAPAPTSF